MRDNNFWTVDIVRTLVEKVDTLEKRDTARTIDVVNLQMEVLNLKLEIQGRQAQGLDHLKKELEIKNDEGIIKI